MKALFATIVAIAPTLFSASLAAQVKNEACTVKTGTYLGWKAERVTNPWVTLTFVPQLGGRLMQVEFNGHPFLFVNPRFRGKYISPDEAKGDWINYGGDKIWPMPEGSQDENHWVIQSTAIDDLPYRFEVVSQGKQCVVRLTGQPDNITGLRIVRTISLGAASPEIRFHAVMENATAHPITWSIQSVSQYDLANPSTPDDYNHDLWAFTPRNPASSFPDGYHVRYGLAEYPAFSVADDMFRLHWTYFGNEVWLDTTAGWLAVVDKMSHYGMVESFDFNPGGKYPGNTTVIFYQNGPSVHFDKSGTATIPPTTPLATPFYMEAEVNSPIVTLQPGGSQAFDTVWHPIAISEQPQEMRAPGVVVEQLKAVHGSQGVSLHGSFSVFSPGTLIASFFNQHGLEVARKEIETVDPAKAIALDTTVPAEDSAVRVYLVVKGTSGEDEGILAKAKIEPAQTR
ncbi:hypothetical protein [Edaphobacter sp. HDX4]|uniref:hypothetical protein n=1 Tax=Edaphobacter sp. HDX4 TaxID=2794064 RepID=UPI002FE50B08